MILLLAMLLAAPERVVVVARKAEKPGIFVKMGNALESAFHRLFQKEDAQVGHANQLAAQGDPEGALKEYDKARERLAEDPALQVDRAGALLKIPDPSGPPAASTEAAQALQHAESTPLRAQAAYTLGLAQEGMGQPEEAIKSYTGALAIDPDDVYSKVNLELLLRTQEERKQKQQAGQPKDQKQQSKDQPQQKPDSSKGEEQKKQEQKQAGEQKKEDQKQQQPQQQDQQPQQKPDEKRQRQAQEQKPVDRTEAERLLDALRASEKNLQAWRFAKKKEKEPRRSEPEKDW